MNTSPRSPKIEDLRVAAYTIPTETEECDGTYCWKKTTLVVVELVGGGKTGLGYTYADRSTAVVIDHALRELVLGADVMNVRAVWDRAHSSVRNLGSRGICATAISAVDTALWDLKAKLLGVSLVQLLGQVREALPIYGSGGFCNYSKQQLQEQLASWTEKGISMVKIKIGRDSEADLQRIADAREAIGARAQLFVDANGAYIFKDALAQAEVFADFDIRWFEEPVSSDDLEGLRLMRGRAPACMEIAAGEYGYDSLYFRRMLAAGAVDVLQADVTRCGGITGFLQAGALCDAFQVPLSAHCAPALHLHVGCAVSALRHAEYFFDHVRIERLLFEGVSDPQKGTLHPDVSRPGLGLEFKHTDAAQYLCKP
ncbi:Mandelate racemase/muconate lactonizing protein [Chthoniobacter flavus Ellin428]|uniref:Mandelate racemase/muconate lactonizing protein n=1 Tax=Chthoniobacter flavus Ellin428 TaxID=497964 RepID=B4CX93_9BACT|nr:enolase C-terminal domain-like protein [Chthoniobacter flavus]EDY20891.1 Mandelate racemase/muconate lactonizing protein [Chthoniobacter flavus Ellin428]TCO85621.1 L-alanine-DL-glutamate epimerase-like enolase superfamily enzyme [Chthoniobacter flavus]